MNFSNIANSNGELTINIIQKVILPNIVIFKGRHVVFLEDDFNSHSRYFVKEYTTSFKCGNENYPKGGGTILLLLILWQVELLKKYK